MLSGKEGDLISESEQGMRYYLIDEISPQDMKKARGFLSTNAITSGLDSLFWVRLPDDLLSPQQYEHDRCRPHVLAVETGADWIKFELFIRALNTMKCTCPAYCSRQQRDFVVNFADSMVEELGIKT
jgi:hypothetical protein